jgi:Chaperone of endosialidase
VFSAALKLIFPECGKKVTVSGVPKCNNAIEGLSTIGGGITMASLLNFTETPNLLELVEAYHAKAGLLGYEVIGLPDSLIDLSLCTDEADDGAPPVQSVCADEGQPPVRFKSDIEQVGANFSVCADEGPAPASDVRLKTDIEQVGTTVYGLPLYHFRYKSGTERFEGVMAQDVLKVMPDAVVVGEDGYYRVKYGQLGIRMTRA